MPAPKLRHYNADIGLSNVTVVPAVAPDRALVGRFVIVGRQGTTVNVSIGGGTEAQHIARSIVLASGETYEQTGVVLLAGEMLIANASAGVVIQFFGQEVDN